jgi:hypothetical protein
MNYSDNYYKKYFKYKLKYFKLKKLLINQSINQVGGNDKYSCNPNKPFLEICEKNSKGMYKSKQKCINDCENKYINYHLISSNIKRETTQFNLFIQDILKDNIMVYIKGGTVLGLKILKMIWKKHQGASFEKYFNEFLKLELIRDWDFAGYTESREIDASYRKQLDKIAKKYNLAPRAKTFILYQARVPIKMDDQALFEIAILEKDDKVGLELPLTTMKVKVNRFNIFHIFMLAKCFYAYKTRQQPIDINVIKYLIQNIKIIIPEHKNGLFLMDKLHQGELSPQLIDFIINFAKDDVNLQQFLITHIQEPHRIFFRLVEKNIPKVNKITLFLNENKLIDKTPTWIFDSKLIYNKIESFIELLGSKMYKLFVDNMAKKISIETSIKQIDDLLNGINLSRIQNEYKNFTCHGIDLLKSLFGRLYTEIAKDTEIIHKLSNKSKLINILQFLNKQKIF